MLMKQCDVNIFVNQIDTVIHNLSDSVHTYPISDTDADTGSGVGVGADDKRTDTSTDTDSNGHVSNKRRKVDPEEEDTTKEDNANTIPNTNININAKTDTSQEHSKSKIGKTVTQIEKTDAPIGLERQYNDLYTLLRRGLLGQDKSQHDIESDGDDNIADENNNDDATNNTRPEKRNVSALLLGPRGQGKSLVLERCLTSLVQEGTRRNNRKNNSYGNGNGNGSIQHYNYPRAPFRVVRLNGVLLRGHDVNVTVREIVRQLSDIASRESYERLRSTSTSISTSEAQSNSNETKDTAITTSNNNNKHDQIHQKLYQILERDSHNLRTRQTTFNNSLAILDEALKTACIDSIPILIVMDELDSFLNTTSSSSSSSQSNNNNNPNNKNNNNNRKRNSAMDVSSKRHLLLYHLLDRVAGTGSLISLVSSTSRLSTIGMFEKRVKSRAEGTTKVIYFGRSSNFESLVDILLSKIDDSIGIGICTGKGKGTIPGNESKEQSNSTMLGHIKEQIKEILSPSQIRISNDEYSNINENSDVRQMKRDKMVMVQDILKRNFILGQNIRWFCRIMSISLSLYIEDIECLLQKQEEEERNIGEDSMPLSSSLTLTLTLPNITANHFMEALTIMGGTDINSKVINLSENHDNDQAKSSMAGNPRIGRLLDLTGPQIAVLLSAKRIIHRDQDRNEISAATILTFERILNEYESNFIAQSKSSGPDNYSQHILFRSFCDLLSGFLKPVKDHTGGGPMQYQYGQNYTIEKKLSLQKVSLHLNIDLEGELGEALKKNLLDCTSALRDWGLSA